MSRIVYHHGPQLGLKPTLSVGRLRNVANLSGQIRGCDIIAHWDSDDWSAPERLAQQVALLESSGADAVGYREMLFWRRDQPIPWNTVHCHCGYTYPRSGAPCPQCHQYMEGEAWLYTNTQPHYCLGTSLCYWRRTWEQKPFPDLTVGEDQEWIRGLKTVGTTATPRRYSPSGLTYSNEPLMVATMNSASSQVAERSPDNWKRVPQWDARLQEIMKL